jgi:hypothetical protein
MKPSSTDLRIRVVQAYENRDAPCGSWPRPFASACAVYAGSSTTIGKRAGSHRNPMVEALRPKLLSAAVRGCRLWCSRLRTPP